MLKHNANNGIFSTKKWDKLCRNGNQRLTFMGINVHHQNGLAEIRTNKLKGMARTVMAHAYRKWPKILLTT